MNKTSLTDIPDMAREDKITIKTDTKVPNLLAGERRLPIILTGKNLLSFVRRDGVDVIILLRSHYKLNKFRD